MLMFFLFEFKLRPFFNQVTFGLGKPFNEQWSLSFLVWARLISRLLGPLAWAWGGLAGRQNKIWLWCDYTNFRICSTYCNHCKHISSQFFSVVYWKDLGPQLVSDVLTNKKWHLIQVLDEFSSTGTCQTSTSSKIISFLGLCKSSELSSWFQCSVKFPEVTWFFL